MYIAIICNVNCSAASLSVRFLIPFVHSLVVRKTAYCNALYVGHPLRLIQKLQKGRNAAGRLIVGVKKFDHIIYAISLSISAATAAQ